MKNTSKSGRKKHTNLDEQNMQIWMNKQANLNEKSSKSGRKNKQIRMNKQANLYEKTSKSG